MSLEDAAEYGIAVARLPQAGADANAAAIAEAPDASPEQRARELVRLLVERSSGPSADVMPFLANLYAETVVYHGKSTPRQAVLLNKHRLADRWTERDYAIRPGSLSATCARAGTTCRVKGVVSWKFYDPKTARRSRGVENFEYRVILAGDVPQIIAETTSDARADACSGPAEKSPERPSSSYSRRFRSSSKNSTFARARRRSRGRGLDAPVRSFICPATPAIAMLELPAGGAGGAAPGRPIR